MVLENLIDIENYFITNISEAKVVKGDIIILMT